MQRKGTQGGSCLSLSSMSSSSAEVVSWYTEVTQVWGDGIVFLGCSYLELLCHLSVLEVSSISNKKGWYLGGCHSPPLTYLVVEGTHLPPGPSEPCRTPMRRGSPELCAYGTSGVFLLCVKGAAGDSGHIYCTSPLCSDIVWPSLTKHKLKDEIIKMDCSQDGWQSRHKMKGGALLSSGALCGSAGLPSPRRRPWSGSL